LQPGYFLLYAEDYYKTQGLPFFMLISSLIYHEMVGAGKAVEGKSLETCILEAKMVKAHKGYSKWVVCNCQKNRSHCLKRSMLICNYRMSCIPKKTNCCV